MSREIFMKFKDIRNFLLESRKNFSSQITTLNTIKDGNVSTSEEVKEAVKLGLEKAEEGISLTNKYIKSVGNKTGTIYRDQTDKSYEWLTNTGTLTRIDAEVTEYINAITVMLARETGDENTIGVAEEMFDVAQRYSNDAKKGFNNE